MTKSKSPSIFRKRAAMYTKNKSKGSKSEGDVIYKNAMKNKFKKADYEPSDNVMTKSLGAKSMHNLGEKIKNFFHRKKKPTHTTEITTVITVKDGEAKTKTTKIKKPSSSKTTITIDQKFTLKPVVDPESNDTPIPGDLATQLLSRALAFDVFGDFEAKSPRESSSSNSHEAVAEDKDTASLTGQVTIEEVD